MHTANKKNSAWYVEQTYQIADNPFWISCVERV